MSVSVDGGKTWHETVTEALEATGDDSIVISKDARGFGEAFKERLRMHHEMREEHFKNFGMKLENRFRDKPWTLEWTWRDYDPKTGKNYEPPRYAKFYLRDTWNGGGMEWGRFPDPYFRFATKEEAEKFAKEVLWDTKDPANRTYKIVRI